MLINNSTSTAVFWWRPATWMRVSGPDAAIFLQGQFTNELRNLPAKHATYGLWLSVKGKVVADSFVLRGAAPDEFWVGSYFSSAETIRARLESFIIADDVQVEDLTCEWSAVTIFGVPGKATAAAESDEFMFAGRRSREPSIERVFKTIAEERVRAEIGDCVELSADEMTRRRLEAGIAAVPFDIGSADLPNEARLETEAISFTKGCYLGQEVMARLKSMGQVRRRLLRVGSSSPGELLRLPAPLFVGARQVGELRTVASGNYGMIGLAMLSLLHVQKETKLSFAADAEPRLVVLETP